MKKLPYEKPEITDEQTFGVAAGDWAWVCSFSPDRGGFGFPTCGPDWGPESDMRDCLPPCFRVHSS